MPSAIAAQQAAPAGRGPVSVPTPEASTASVPAFSTAVVTTPPHAGRRSDARVARPAPFAVPRRRPRRKPRSRQPRRTPGAVPVAGPMQQPAGRSLDKDRPTGARTGSGHSARDYLSGGDGARLRLTTAPLSRGGAVRCAAVWLPRSHSAGRPSRICRRGSGSPDAGRGHSFGRVRGSERGRGGTDRAGTRSAWRSASGRRRGRVQARRQRGQRPRRRSVRAGQAPTPRPTVQQRPSGSSPRTRTGIRIRTGNRSRARRLPDGPRPAPAPNAAQSPSDPENGAPAAAALPASRRGSGPGPGSATATAGAQPPATDRCGPLQPQLAKPLFTLAGAPHGQHIMTLKVSPEDLGPLTVRAQIDAAGVRIELFAAGDAGRDAVRGILPELRKELTGAGFGASLDLSEHSGPGGARPAAVQGRDGGQGAAGGDPGGSGAGQGGRNGPGEPRTGTPLGRAGRRCSPTQRQDLERPPDHPRHSCLTRRNATHDDPAHRIPADRAADGHASAVAGAEATPARPQCGPPSRPWMPTSS